MELRTFNSYNELKEMHQKEVNAFPFIWVFAFSDEEFIKKMAEKIKERKPQCAEITTKEGIAKHVVSIGAGGFVLKEDVSAMNEMFKKHKEEEKLFKKNQKNMVEAIEAEMWNHEYAYTRDPEDTLVALGRTGKSLQNDPEFKKLWKKAEKKVFAKYAELEELEEEEGR